MKFENGVPDETVNVSKGSPARDFLAMVLAVVTLAALAAVALVVAAGWIAPRVPFAVEVGLADRYFPPKATREERERAVQSLADEIARHMQVPDGMRLTVHFQDEPTVNALATLGGHIVIFRGLVERLQSEDALAMVLAHEIAHIKHRDPITGLGRGFALGLALGTVSASAGQMVGERMIGSAATLTTLRFGREQERDADRAALAALAARYGHVGGAIELFEVFVRLSEARGEPPPFAATHPGSREREAAVRDLARQNGWPLEGSTRPLPDVLRPRSLAH